MIRVVRERDYAQFVRIRLYNEDDSDLSDSWNLQSGGVPAPLVRRVKRNVGEVFKKASVTNSLSSTQVEKLTSDISPVIRQLFEGKSPVFDDLCVLSEHDDYTHQHSWMVMLLSLAVLRGAWDRGILLPDAQLRLDVGLGAVLHDLGKTHIPLEVLNKPGKLNRQEWALIKSHPQEGYDMLRDNEILMPLAKAIVAHHHQYLDGSGYGAGERSPLSQEDIPHIVRIATVVDVYDALVSERPYRLAYLPFQALGFLEANSGSKFDDGYIRILRKTVMDFPGGCVLLFSRGVVGCVTRNFEKEKENPEVTILGILSRETANLLGKTYRLQEADFGLPGEKDILIGAASLESLAEKIRREARFKGLAKLIAPWSDRTLICHSQWEELFDKHLGFLAADDFALEEPEPVMRNA
jgi:HD-GYP domain-containing protein (c-di-GMP phosphodiesterase class II)